LVSSVPRDLFPSSSRCSRIPEVSSQMFVDVSRTSIVRMRSSDLAACARIVRAQELISKGLVLKFVQRSELRTLDRWIKECSRRVPQHQQDRQRSGCFAGCQLRYPCNLCTRMVWVRGWQTDRVSCNPMRLLLLRLPSRCLLKGSWMYSGHSWWHSPGQG